MKKVEYAFTNAAEAIQKALDIVRNGGKFLSASEVAGFIYITVQEASENTITGVEADLVVIDERSALDSAGEPATPAAKATGKRGKK